MKTITWIPGSNESLDKIFDETREKQYQNKEHRLWKNYDKDAFQFAIALTICFNNDNEPEICSSIASRDCWPIGVYRILYRTWKNTNKQPLMKKISEAMGQATLSQIDWLHNNVDCKLLFIGRQTDNWTEWVAKNYKKQFNLDFEIGKNKYLTCPNECDDTCWQSILYQGNDKILKKWKHR